MRMRITNAAMAEPIPASVSMARAIDSPRDRVECVIESPATRSIDGNKAGDIVSSSIESQCNEIRI